eukprot:12147639-Alexandrium_andersonii.AAC.1
MVFALGFVSGSLRAAFTRCSGTASSSTPSTRRPRAARSPSTTIPEQRIFDEALGTQDAAYFDSGSGVLHT